MNYGENYDRRGDDSASDQHNSYACDRCGLAGWIPGIPGTPMAFGPLICTFV